jgi:DNA-directed RNA polymerase sigma subunit (sigma70/sigma32)
VAYANKDDYTEYQRNYKRKARGFKKQENLEWFNKTYPRPNWQLLDPEERYLLEKFYIEGVTFTQISIDLNLSRDRLYSLKKGALRRLRNLE